MWDAESGDELATLRHEAEVRQTSWNADGSRILTRSDDGTVMLWYARMDELLEGACQSALCNMTP